MAHITQYRDIPVHYWDANSAPKPFQAGGYSVCIQRNKHYSRVMDRVGEALAAGAAVTLEHRIANERPGPKAQPYDVIDVRIEHLK